MQSLAKADDDTRPEKYKLSARVTVRGALMYFVPTAAKAGTHILPPSK
jgi:hypothetical protein